MNINHVKNILQVYGENTPLKSAKRNEREAVYSKDEVVLSTQAQNFSQILQLAKKGTDTVRMDRVEEISKQIQNGSYQLDARLIAEKMLNARY